MNLGIALGGAAEGFAKGVKLADQLEENKLARETRTREREARALDDAIVMPGDTMPSTRAAPAPVQDKGMLGALIAQLVPHEAARAAGLPTLGIPGSPETLAAQSAPAPTASINTAAPAAATEDATVAEITARPPRPTVATEADTLRQMMAAAAKRGDRETQAKLWPVYVKATTDDKRRDLQMAYERGMPGLAEYSSRFTNSEVTYNPDPSAPGKFIASFDGEAVPGSHTPEEFLARAIGHLEADPMAGPKYSMLLSAADRDERKTLASEQLAAARAQVAQFEAQTKAQRAAYQNAGDAADTRKTQTETATLARQEAAHTNFSTMLAEDPLTNAEPLAAIVQSPEFAKYNYMVPVYNADGTKAGERPANHMAENLATIARAAAERFKNNEFAKSGEVRLLPTPQGRLYLVNNGKDGQYRNFDDALLAARNARKRAAKPTPIPTTRK